MLKDVAIITVATIVDFPYFFEKRANNKQKYWISEYKHEFSLKLKEVWWR